MISKSLFGNNLKQQRKFFGWTQLQAAENAGIERETWGKYERGVSMPNGDVLISFMKMGIDIAALFSTKPVENKSASQLSNTPKLPQEEQELLDIFRQLNNLDRHALKRQAQMLLLMAQQEKKADENIEIPKTA